MLIVILGGGNDRSVPHLITVIVSQSHRPQNHKPHSRVPLLSIIPRITVWQFEWRVAATELKDNILVDSLNERDNAVTPLDALIEVTLFNKQSQLYRLTFVFRHLSYEVKVYNVASLWRSTSIQLQ